MGQGTLPRLALPVRDNDEIGQLTQAFNDLLAKIEQQEAQAIEIVSNRRLRKILHNVPGMVFQYRSHAGDGGDFLFASEGALGQAAPMARGFAQISRVNSASEAAPCAVSSAVAYRPMPRWACAWKKSASSYGTPSSWLMTSDGMGSATVLTMSPGFGPASRASMWSSVIC